MPPCMPTPQATPHLSTTDSVDSSLSRILCPRAAITAAAMPARVPFELAVGTTAVWS